MPKAVVCLPTYNERTNLEPMLRALNGAREVLRRQRKDGLGPVVLGVPVRDMTSGFKCYRREVLVRIDLDAIASKGYAFQVETTYRTLRAGFRLVEIPIMFVDRANGASKMSKAIVAEAIWKMPALLFSRYGSNRQGAR